MPPEDREAWMAEIRLCADADRLRAIFRFLYDSWGCLASDLYNMAWQKAVHIEELSHGG